MNTDGYNRALGSVCDWCLIPEVGQNHFSPNHSFLSALVKHEVSEERGFFILFFFLTTVFLNYICLKMCHRAAPESKCLTTLTLSLGVNGAG